jgi:hypothetical protein
MPFTCLCPIPAHPNSWPSGPSVPVRSRHRFQVADDCAQRARARSPWHVWGEASSADRRLESKDPPVVRSSFEEAPGWDALPLLGPFWQRVLLVRGKDSAAARLGIAFVPEEGLHSGALVGEEQWKLDVRDASGQSGQIGRRLLGNAAEGGPLLPRPPPSCPFSLSVLYSLTLAYHQHRYLTFARGATRRSEARWPRAHGEKGPWNSTGRAIRGRH